MEDFYRINILVALSFAVVCCNIFSTYWLAAIEVVNDCGFSIYSSVCQVLWQAARPTIIGIALSFLMWQMVFLNSTIPGIDPPTPFTPKELRPRNSSRFQLDYVFAVMIGLLTTFTLLIRELYF